MHKTIYTIQRLFDKLKKSTITAARVQKKDSLDGWMETFTFWYSTDTHYFLTLHLCQTCSWSDTLTFLQPHSGNCHERINISLLSAPLSLNERQRFVYGGLVPTAAHSRSAAKQLLSGRGNRFLGSPRCTADTGPTLSEIIVWLKHRLVLSAKQHLGFAGKSRVKGQAQWHSLLVVCMMSSSHRSAIMCLQRLLLLQIQQRRQTLSVLGFL